jgi:hypothetical protein
MAGFEVTTEAFLERLTPASSQSLLKQDLIVPPEHDPRDPEQPAIHVTFASSAELNRGVQMALVGGIGSGKTTELLLTRKLLSRHDDAVNVFIDLAETTDLNELNPGAILIAIGMRLYMRLAPEERVLPEIKSAYGELTELARGKTDWVRIEQYESFDKDPEEKAVRPIHTPGLLKPRFPAIHRKVSEVLDPFVQIAELLLEQDAQITVLLDGLDRQIQAERFREFAEQDLHALRGIPISIIVTTPLMSWYDKSRFLHDYFDIVRHIPAAVSDPLKSDFLKKILLRRGAAELMDDQEIGEISRFSGGVLRDLITLARSSAEAAYREDEDRIGGRHVHSAVRQLGKRYLVGLGNPQRRLIRRLVESDEFSPENATARELLVNRQVLEYFSEGRDYFAVHPSLAAVLPESA